MLDIFRFVHLGQLLMQPQVIALTIRSLGTYVILWGPRLQKHSPYSTRQVFEAWIINHIQQSCLFELWRYRGDIRVCYHDWLLKSGGAVTACSFWRLVERSLLGLYRSCRFQSARSHAVVFPYLIHDPVDLFCIGHKMRTLVPSPICSSHWLVRKTLAKSIRSRTRKLLGHFESHHKTAETPRMAGTSIKHDINRYVSV